MFQLIPNTNTLMPAGCFKCRNSHRIALPQIRWHFFGAPQRRNVEAQIIRSVRTHLNHNSIASMDTDHHKPSIGSTEIALTRQITQCTALADTLAHSEREKQRETSRFRRRTTRPLSPKRAVRQRGALLTLNIDVCCMFHVLHHRTRPPKRLPLFPVAQLYVQSVRHGIK